jgi:hypothetical protein
VSSGLPLLSVYVVNRAECEGRSMIGERNQVSNEIFHQVEDQLLVVPVKSIALSEFVEKLEMENEIENLSDLRHP